MKKTGDYLLTVALLTLAAFAVAGQETNPATSQTAKTFELRTVKVDSRNTNGRPQINEPRRHTDRPG